MNPAKVSKRKNYSNILKWSNICYLLEKKHKKTAITWVNVSQVLQFITRVEYIW